MSKHLFLPLLLAALSGCLAPQEAPVSSSHSAARGADLGWLTQLEDRGVTWVDAEGTATDPVVLLKNLGVNAVRLRVMVDPGRTDFVTVDGEGNETSLLGYCDPAHVLAMAQRCQAQGLRLLIDFHFSDTWADPAHQTVPDAWKDDTLEELKTHLAGHVTDVLQDLKDAGVTPDWVQLGNEIPQGILWGTTVSAKVSGSTGWTTLAALLNAGYAAVKAVSPQTLVVLHLDRGYDNDLYRWWFDAYQAAGGKWDVVGVSFYPYWQPAGTVEQLKDNLLDMESRYGKKVMVCEIGGPYNAAGSTKTLLSDVLEVVDSIGGLGVFYWEPESHPDVVLGYTLGASAKVSTGVLRFTSALTAY